MIYKTKWGSYIDLSKIVSIDTVCGGFADLSDIRIHCQLLENPIEVQFWDRAKECRPDHTPENNAEAFKKDLIDAWIRYQTHGNFDIK